MWRITIEAEEDKIASRVLRFLKKMKGIKLSYHNVESEKGDYYGGD